jgi:leader peptidase (prepilin peptidase)/N-methyltransferase
MILADFPPWFLRGFAVLFGLLWGSFLNVVIYRVPRGMSVSHPPSHCPACKAPVRPYDNIPVLTWVFLRGRARCCGAKISPRYVLVELIGGVLSLAVLERHVMLLGPGISMGYALAVYLASFALALGLVAGAFIDFEHMILPDSITIGGTILGLATASFRHMTYVESIGGAVAGFAAVWLPFIVIYPKVRGKKGMGLGDAKLLALAGAWFGWYGALLVLGAGAVQGTLGAILTLLRSGKIDDPEEVKREREEIQRELEAMSPEERAEAEKELAEDPMFQEAGEGLGQARMAFGPFLALAAIEMLLIGRETVLGWIWGDL